MARLKVFTNEGINEFRTFLVELKNNPELNKPDLSSINYSDNFQPEVTVDESIIFSSRMGLAEYLTQMLQDAGIKSKDVILNDKLWDMVNLFMV